MRVSFLYHALGVREQECSGIRYEDKRIILQLQTREEKLRCPCCKSKDIICSGSHIRTIRSVPIGSKEILLELKFQRICCKTCGCIRQENVHFVTGKQRYSSKFKKLVVELSRIGTIKDVANHLHVSWDTVK
ncbi:helix-turn-helix domain-containing protein [Paludibacter sp. 221]|uniref:helix-turn-helix domain-containing protein n=1 Tax=Paludibacter sp. 221 TaxID=2302939 RepID=UPI001EF3217E|nr:helix-turn-helix domain-containing protein [Paludibacter sp. 221]